MIEFNHPIIAMPIWHPHVQTHKTHTQGLRWTDMARATMPIALMIEAHKQKVAGPCTEVKFCRRSARSFEGGEH